MKTKKPTKEKIIQITVIPAHRLHDELFFPRILALTDKGYLYELLYEPKKGDILNCKRILKTVL